MTQLTLGLDRDSALVAGSFDERDPAVKNHARHGHQGLPRPRASTSASAARVRRDHPDLAEWLLDQGIESMSLNPDTVVDTWLRLAKVSG